MWLLIKSHHTSKSGDDTRVEKGRKKRREITGYGSETRSYFARSSIYVFSVWEHHNLENNNHNPSKNLHCKKTRHRTFQNLLLRNSAEFLSYPILSETQYYLDQLYNRSISSRPAKLPLSVGYCGPEFCQCRQGRNAETLCGKRGRRESRSTGAEFRRTSKSRRYHIYVAEKTFIPSSPCRRL